MLIKLIGAKCIGINAVPVFVEVNINQGLGIHLVGLADIAVKESLLRTMTALQSAGFKIPGKKIVINLAPADIHKNGSGFDLPIALGIIAASGQIEFPDMEDFLIMGELGLDASVRPIKGALPMVELAQQRKMRACILPLDSASEAAGCYDIPLYGVRNLMDVLLILTNGQVPSGKGGISEIKPTFTLFDHKEAFYEPMPLSDDIMDFSEIIGQENAKRGLEIAAAGSHNAIMIGTPGSGKSSLAKALAGILPPISREEAIITSKIYSVAGKRLSNEGLICHRPFRAPHYSASMPAIIGGGNGENIMPGEVSLAQFGILFLDEFTQIPRNVAESLRGPLEDRKVIISRLRSRVEYPASFMLVAAANPCPCGYYGDGDRCTCTLVQRTNYLSKLSGPIMDRIDIQIWMHPVDAKLLVNAGRKPQGESSRTIARRVTRARAIQAARFAGSGIFTNSEMNNRQINTFCPLSAECKELMEKIVVKMGLSARAYTRVVKMARTIADLEMAAEEMRWNGEDRLTGNLEEIPIGPKHLLEAASYRFLDKNKA